MVSSTKTDKITRILLLYHQLLNGQPINKSMFSWEHGINERSFDRDIEDIRLFLNEIYSTREVQFDRDTGTYFLTGESTTAIERMDAAIIAKIILDSKALRADEMHGLYDALLKASMPKDAAAISNYLHHDTENYQSNINSALIKTIGDLYAAIESGMDIQVIVASASSCFQPIKLSPLEIKVENSRFILVAATNMDLAQIACYPIEKIDSFVILKTSFAHTLRSRYFEKGKK